MTAGPSRAPDRIALVRLQSIFALLPGAILVWPLIHGSLTPSSEAAGWVLIASMPACLLLLLRGIELRVAGLLLLLVTLASALARAGSVPDRFEADRAVAILLAALVALVGGASVGPKGWRILSRGLALTSLVWIVGAALDSWIEPARAFSGVLENTGDTSEAALPGALAGFVLLADRKASAASRALGGLAAGFYALYVGLVPVYAGAAAFFTTVAACVVASVVRPDARYRARVGLLIALPLAVALSLRPALLPAPTSVEPATSEQVVDPGSTGGFEVRKRIWARVPAMVLDHPFLGVGPGQFERSFPPYRDPLEIRLSTQDHRAPSNVDVEHAHNDWLQAVAEYGLVGGGAWVLFLGIVLARAATALAGSGANRAALGAVALGVLVNALFNSPLFANAPASALACAAFGALLGESGASRSWASRGRLLALLLLVLVARQVQPSLRLARHGRALAALTSAPLIQSDGSVGQLASDVEPILARALEARSDSVVALSKRAQLLAATGDTRGERQEVLEQILAARPHRFEALLDLGNLHARAGHFGRARELYERAAGLDPEHPGLAWNRIKLAIQAGRLDQLERALEQAEGRLVENDSTWAKAAAEALLRGRPDLARGLLMRLGPGWVPETGLEANALTQKAQDAGHPLLADAFQCTAQQLFASENVESGLVDRAVVNLRLALRHSRSKIEGGDRSLQLEFAAAHVLNENTAEARTLVQELEPGPSDLLSLPSWAQRALGQLLLESPED